MLSPMMNRMVVAMAALSASALAKPVSCPIVFDGRVPSDAALTDFDEANGGGWNPFNPDYVKGAGLEWSDIILLRDQGAASPFDAEDQNVALEVTISDDSIFNNQNGFRRAGLQFRDDSNNGSPGSSGRVTFHFSLHVDGARAFNLSHEYLLVWHEAADYSSNQFNFEAGTIIGQEGLPADTYKLLSRQNELLWSTPIVSGMWQNFAITLDYDNDSLHVWYSKGNATLESATEVIANDNSGEGQYQFGILKKPTGTSDVVNGGYQESPVDEGLIYGGVFIEDSTGDCVSV